MRTYRSRVLGALVYGVVAVTALGTPVLAGTAALGAGGADGAGGSTRTSAAAGVATGESGMPAAYAATNGAPAAPVKLTGELKFTVTIVTRERWTSPLLMTTFATVAGPCTS